MFKMSPVCTHACSQSLSPLADSQVNDVLLHTMPDVVETLLQLIDVVDARFIHPLLHDAPDLVVDVIQVWIVGRSEVRTNEVSQASLSAATGWYYGRDVPERCLAGRQTCRLPPVWLRQQDIAVVLAINFHSGVDKHRVNSYDGLNLRIFGFNKFPG